MTLTITRTATHPDLPTCISRHCDTPVSQAKVRHHFKHLMGLGFSASEANNASGRCGRCIRKFLIGHKLAS